MVKHRRSQGAMAPKFSENLVILRFERWYPKQNTVGCQKSYILAPLKFFAPPKMFGMAAPL